MPLTYDAGDPNFSDLRCREGEGVLCSVPWLQGRLGASVRRKFSTLYATLYAGVTRRFRCYGNGCAGATVSVRVKGVEKYHEDLAAKNYKYLWPGIGTTPGNSRCLNVIDPFGNKIRFFNE
jgi:hypothetical protein